jgi:hypothetical protein
MANKFFPAEPDVLAANTTFESAWRSAGVGAGTLTAIGSFQALVSADQPVTAWIEFSDDGATILGQTEPSTIGAATGAVPLRIQLCAEYFRVGVNNPAGAAASANISVKTSFNR